jgi:hypothetical protein
MTKQGGIEMEGKARMKRIDKIGSTAEIPYTRTIKDVKSQRWIANRLYRLMGRGALFWERPEESLGANVMRGANYFDLKDTGDKIKTIEEVPKENIRSQASGESRQEGGGCRPPRDGLR